MNRNTRTLLVLAIAVVMAAIASYGVYLAVRSMPVREVEVVRAQAVVAARSLNLGAMLTKDDVKLVPWPAANQIPGGFTEIERVVNRGLIVPVAENEPLT
jgi:Flp pilus assembly protein CpaB